MRHLNPLAGQTTFSTSPKTLYTAETLCFVNIYLDYIQNADDITVFINSTSNHSGYLSPNKSRQTITLPLAAGDSVILAANSRSFTTWARVDVFEIIQ